VTKLYRVIMPVGEAEAAARFRGANLDPVCFVERSTMLTG